MLTLHEAIPKDQELDIDAREQILKEARELIHDEFEVARDSIGLGHVDAILAELRVKLRGEADRVDGGRGSVMHVFSPAVVVVASLAMGASRLCSGAGGRR